MAKAFDATLNTLIDDHIIDWTGFLVARCGVPEGPASVLDTDLSTTLQADRLFRIDGPVPAAVHLELESAGRLGIPDELLRYNVAARAVAKVPVHSVLDLLRPKATASDLSGQLDINGANGVPYLIFRYTVVRVWQESLLEFLGAGPGVAPLALLTNEAAADLPSAFGQLCDRLRANNIADNVVRSLLGSTFVLCGLRYQPAQIEALYRNLTMTLEDSTTYQLIFSKGEVRGEARGRTAEAQTLILSLGGQRFGAAPQPVEEAVRALTDCERLERIALRVLTATDWADLLATP